MTLSEQKAQKAFELRDSRDILEKLKWELNNLFCRQRHDIAVCQYHAFNCAITAWHVTDWLWQDISPEIKCKLQERFQIRRNPDPTISSVISDGEGYDYGNPIIVEGDTRHSADKVFYTALHWFEAFVRDSNIFPDEPFVPTGDR